MGKKEEEKTKAKENDKTKKKIKNKEKFNILNKIKEIFKNDRIVYLTNILTYVALGMSTLLATLIIAGRKLKKN